MRIMATLDLPTTGQRAASRGWDVVNFPSAVRARIGWMPDAFGAHDHMTVFEYLDFYARAFGFASRERARAHRRGHGFHRPDAHRRPHDEQALQGHGATALPGRTLLHDPDVLILDEPAAGLDPKARVEFKQLVRLLAEEGKTIFISSHILSELGEMCDTMLFIDGGAVVHHGSAESLQHRQDGAAVFDVHVHGAPEVLTRWVESTRRAAGGRAQARRAGELRVGRPGGASAAQLKRMLQDGVPVIDFHRESRKLEDAFVDMLKYNFAANPPPPVENAALPPPTIPLYAPPRADFADWLSPMLVKELRQGVRTRVFVLLFILLQLLMLLDLVAEPARRRHRAGRLGRHGVFLDHGGGCPSLVILPIGGLNAVGGEIKANTLELIFLTRLTAFRIVFGKWCALFAQSPPARLRRAALPGAAVFHGRGQPRQRTAAARRDARRVRRCSSALATGLSAYPARVVRPLAAVCGVVGSSSGGVNFLR